MKTFSSNPEFDLARGSSALFVKRLRGKAGGRSRMKRGPVIAENLQKRPSGDKVDYSVGSTARYISSWRVDQELIYLEPSAWLTGLGRLGYRAKAPSLNYPLPEVNPTSRTRIYHRNVPTHTGRFYS